MYYFLTALSFIIGNLPAFTSYSFAGALGYAAFYLWPRGRRNMTRSIAAVLCRETDSPEVIENARRGLQNYYKFIVDILRYAHPSKDFFEKDVDLIGLENIDKALALGRGVILVGLHMGNLDMGVRALGHAGYPISAIVQTLESGGVDRFVQKARSSSGVKLVTAAEGVFPMLNALKRNEIVALMIEGRVYEKGIPVKFGNKYFRVPSGMAVMALRTGAKVIPCGLIRSTNTKFHGIACKPVQFESAGNPDEDARELTQQTIYKLAEMAAIFADQWYIFHDLIKDDIPGSSKT